MPKEQKPGNGPSPEERARAFNTIFMRNDIPVGKLGGVLKEHIGKNGPVSFEDYMRLALYHPSAGYYTANPAIATRAGEKPQFADFITNPVEYSPAFGASVGEMAIQLGLGSGTLTQVVSIAAGNGILDRDFLANLKARHADIYNRLGSDLKYRIIETSPVQITRIKETLAAAGIDEGKYEIVEQNGVTFLEQDPPLEWAFVVSNEWLDILPMKKFERDDKGKWREVMVGVSTKGKKQLQFELGDELRPGSYEAEYLEEIKQRCPLLYGDRRPTTLEVATAIGNLLRPGLSHSDIRGLSTELSEAIEVRFATDTPHFIVSPLLRNIGQALGKLRSSYILTMDYGTTGILPDEDFRFYPPEKNSNRLSPAQLNEPGMYDITADVDFIEFGRLVGLPVVGGRAVPDTHMLYHAGGQHTQLANQHIEGRGYLAILHHTIEVTPPPTIIAEIQQAGTEHDNAAVVERICARIGIPFEFILSKTRDGAPQTRIREIIEEMLRLNLFAPEVVQG